MWRGEGHACECVVASLAGGEGLVLRRVAIEAQQTLDEHAVCMLRRACLFMYQQGMSVEFR